jgi:excisionase family DNA binding protein
VSKPHIPNLITIKEAAGILRVCPKTVRRRIADGTLKASKISNRVRIDLRDLKAYFHDMQLI